MANNLLAGLAFSSIQVANLHLVDFDNVDPTNMNRQVLFRLDQQGQAKADVLAEVAEDMLPGCTVSRDADAFAPEQLRAFVDKVGTKNTMVALLSDNWSSRLDAMDQAFRLGVPACLFAGTSFAGARVRLFGADVEHSFCLRCGPETAGKRARNEVERGCSGRPDASMVIPNVCASAASISLLESWLAGDSFPTAGYEISLVSQTRYAESTPMEPCTCPDEGFPVIGELRYGSNDFELRLGRAVTLAPGISAVGTRTPSGSFAAFLCLAPGLEARERLDSEVTGGAILLEAGTTYRIGGTPTSFIRLPFDKAAAETGVVNCSYCFCPLSPDVQTHCCSAGHLLCRECAACGCQYCEENDA